MSDWDTLVESVVMGAKSFAHRQEMRRLFSEYRAQHCAAERENICGTCAREWAGTCTFEAAKDRPAPYDQTCRYATSQWTRKGITR